MPGGEVRRQLNRAAGGALAVAMLSLYMAFAFAFTPAKTGYHPFIQWVIDHVGVWSLVALHLVAALALIGSLWKERRLAIGLCFCSVVFMLWGVLAIAPVLPLVDLGGTKGSLLGLGTYGWFSAYSARLAWSISHLPKAQQVEPCPHLSQGTS